MTIFSVGPVEMYPATRAILGAQEPYFRTAEFSAEVLAAREAFLTCVNAPADAKFALLTASGSGAMEAAVTNLLAPGDGAIVVNTGSFGNRFVELCRRAGARVTEVTLPFLEGDLTPEMLENAFAKACEAGEGAAPAALFIQGCETSSGRKFDLAAVGAFCAAHGMLFVVDAVSAFLADEIDMKVQRIDLVLTASQKALSLTPGMSFIVAGPRALTAIERNHGHAAAYFDLPNCFKNMEQGQTPYTCPVANVLAFRQRICDIAERGVQAEMAIHAARAAYFRGKLPELGFALPDMPLSNCCTPLVFADGGAQESYKRLRYEFGLTLCPSGGANADRILRVGHMGNLCEADYDAVEAALKAIR